jgi:sugar/nucleoside kinase (ribokinase family)
VTLVTVDSSAERSFIHHLGANAHFSPDDFDWERVGGARHLHLTSLFVLPAMDGAPAAALLEEARRRGLTTSVDLCWDREERWMSLLRPCLSHVDFFMPSEEEAASLTGETEPERMAQQLLAAGCGSVVIKLGERGCLYADASQARRLPAFDVPVRETTGAGDCFIAGFLYSRLQGRPLEAALRFANACGARAVTAVGAVTAMVSAAEIETWAASLPVREDL